MHNDDASWPCSFVEVIVHVLMITWWWSWWWTCPAAVLKFPENPCEVCCMLLFGCCWNINAMLLPYYWNVDWWWNMMMNACCSLGNPAQKCSCLCCFDVYDTKHIEIFLLFAWCLCMMIIWWWSWMMKCCAVVHKP